MQLFVLWDLHLFANFYLDILKKPLSSVIKIPLYSWKNGKKRVLLTQIFKSSNANLFNITLKVCWYNLCCYIFEVANVKLSTCIIREFEKHYDVVSVFPAHFWIRIPLVARSYTRVIKSINSLLSLSYLTQKWQNLKPQDYFRRRAETRRVSARVASVWHACFRRRKYSLVELTLIKANFRVKENINSNLRNKFNYYIYCCGTD